MAQSPPAKINSNCQRPITGFAGYQYNFTVAGGFQGSGGVYNSSGGASGLFVQGGTAGGFNLGGDVFVGFMRGGTNTFRGRTDSINIGFEGFAVSLIFQPDSAFNSSTFLGAIFGPGPNFGLSVSKDNTVLIFPTPSTCGT
jgi:hypothetical protein